MSEIDFEAMDEETAAQVRAALAAKDQELAGERAKLARRAAIDGDELLGKYPRAISALRSRTIGEPELSGDELEAWLKAKEAEYVALNVPDPTAKPPEVEPVATPPAPSSPAEGWGSPVASGMAPTPDVAAALEQNLSSLGRIDADAIKQLDHLNTSNDGRRGLRELSNKLMDKRPIISG